VTRCPNCSGENADTQRFCGECGTPLPATTHKTPSNASVDETIPLPSAELLPGALFARRYQVIEELGVGGMGRVYRVLDRKLDEEIALKLIRPEIASDRAVLERFSSELKLARQVVAKNVARMFDLNEEGNVPYITMEYVRGENLRRLIRKVGRLAAGQAIPIACQICEGLAEAHRLGIVHRDLKPQNVMIDEDGQAKIMDFGLARLLAHDGRDDSGSRSGTPAYVSPEQIRSLPVDGRSDLYSLGVLMYEMLTGETPFKATSVDELIDMQLNEPPRDLREINAEIPAELSRIVLKCLEKDPANRYKEAAEVREALGCVEEQTRPGTLPGARKAEASPRVRTRPVLRFGLAAVAVGLFLVIVVFRSFFFPSSSWKSSLAVLPVEEVGAEQSHQNLCAGLQDEIIDRLSSIPRLRVLPSLTVNSHDLKGKTYPQIKKSLGVKDLLRLTLFVEGNTVFVKLYLIAGEGDASPIPMTYSKDLGSYRVLQDQIANYTARALGVDLAEEQIERIRRRGTDNIEAYGLYLDGTKALGDYGEQYREEDFDKSVRDLQRAVELDPRFALAFWAIGSAYENRYFSPRRDKDPSDLEKMYENFEKASRLDPDFAETNLGLGWYYFNKGDNSRAFDSFKKALKLSPRDFKVNIEAGAFLRSIALYKEAIPFFSRAAEITPHDAAPLIQIAQCWSFLGQYEKAARLAGQASSFNPNDAEACGMHAASLILSGKLEEGEREIGALKNIDPEYPRLRPLQALAAAARGEKDKALELMGPHASVGPQTTAAYLLLGMTDEAISNIEAGIERGFRETGSYIYSYPSLIDNPAYKGLRGLPRFEAVLKSQKEKYSRELKKFEGL
jgi:serine/threonine protein kinase/tetratricopeptide (TPR) repeat protein